MQLYFHTLIHNKNLKCLFAGVWLPDEVVPNPGEPVSVLVLLVETVRSTHQDGRGQDGGRAHEIGLTCMASK